MLRRLLYWLSGHLPARYIRHEGKPYLERYYLCTIGSIRVYLHRFVACDEDGVHDHPFRYSLSTILAGWYYEDRWAKRYKRRWFNFIGPNDFHRVVLPHEAPHDVWTLFAHVPRSKPWGFLRASARGSHGPVFQYLPQSEPDDPGLSSWHLTAPKGRALREQFPQDQVPLGMNAYAHGTLKYPPQALTHSLAYNEESLPAKAPEMSTASANCRM
jgi:hypothetical protein